MNLNAKKIGNSSIIRLTDNAAIKINELLKDENNSKLSLRVFIKGEGCSGFRYGFAFDEAKNDDICIEKKVRDNNDPKKNAEEEDEEGANASVTIVKLIVDPMSLQYLTGAEIDYKVDIKGEQFIIRNPMAKTTCGCGSSFSV